MNSFKTQVDLDLTINRPDNFEIETKKMNLRWNAEFEMRSYGVKSVIITVPDQQVSLDIRVWGDDEDTFETLTLDIKDVIIERQNEGLEFLIPQTLEFFKGKWKLVF